MRVKSLLAAVCVWLVSAVPASAEIVPTLFKTTDGVHDYFHLYLKATGDAGTRLQGYDIAMQVTNTAAGLLVIDRSVDLDEDGINDINLAGEGWTWPTLTVPNQPTHTMPASAGRLGSGSAAMTGYYTTTTTGVTRKNWDGVDPPVFDQNAWIERLSANFGAAAQSEMDNQPGFLNIKELRVVQAFTGSAPLANTNYGYYAMVAKVPTGANVRFVGEAGGNLSPRPDPIDIQVPEPGTMSLLALGAMAFLGRRSRKA